MGEHRESFGDAEIVVVTFTEPARLDAHRTHLGVPFTFVADPTRELYTLLGAERGSRRQVWSIGTLRMYARLMRSGRRLRRPTEDVYQLGADAVVGRDGTLRYVSVPTSPDKRPSVSALVAALDHPRPARANRVTSDGVTPAPGGISPGAVPPTRRPTS